MIKATFDSGNFSLVDDYAAQYDYTYPKGRYSFERISFKGCALWWMMNDSVTHCGCCLILSS